MRTSWLGVCRFKNTVRVVPWVFKWVTYPSATAQETLLQHLAAQPGPGRIQTPTHPSKQTTIKTPQAAATTSIKTTTQPPPQPREAPARHHTTAAQKQWADAKLRPCHLYLSNPLAGNRGFLSVTAGKQTQSPVAPNTK